MTRAGNLPEDIMTGSPRANRLPSGCVRPFQALSLRGLRLNTMNRKLLVTGLGGWLSLSGLAHAVEPKSHPFFPFCIDWHDAKKRSFEQQAVMLKELGYEGVGHIYLDKVAERLKT